MEDTSKKAIQDNCPHCDPTSFSYRHLLSEMDHFRVVADVHPLVKGHLLIIPKKHITCVGAYEDNLFQEFKKIYQRVSKFVRENYGSISTFEHGKIGQTVFHSHVHLLPFGGDAADIVPEGSEQLTILKEMSDLRNIYEKEGQYLFFSLGDNKWTAASSLARPGFFRHRFASAIGNPERGDWKAMHISQKLMSVTDQENQEVASYWRKEKPLAV